ncbi:translation initiation factor IF-2-like [Eriocheir sinensis]|uniref:translation initiation factor IF-2-like n=1 Tax=Eriocheir sinensis TaxID=95602 RepID=UPI0021C6D240|nr:translation initiation factor IF-2-like [Eriocheir sinensis]
MGGTCSRETSPPLVGPRVSPAPKGPTPRPAQAWPGRTVKFLSPAGLLKPSTFRAGTAAHNGPAPLRPPTPSPRPDANQNWKHSELVAWRRAGAGQGAPPPRRATSAPSGPDQLEAAGWRAGQSGPRLGSGLRWGSGGLGEGLVALCWHYHPHYLR